MSAEPTTICWDVDTQIDFIMADGKLAVPGAEDIISNLEALTDWAHGTKVRIVATADDHDVGHAEITDNPDWVTTFPPHCMRGTAGQKKIPETMLRAPLLFQPVPMDLELVATEIRLRDGDILLNKPGTDVFRWNPERGHGAGDTRARPRRGLRCRDGFLHARRGVRPCAPPPAHEAGDCRGCDPRDQRGGQCRTAG